MLYTHVMFSLSFVLLFRISLVTASVTLHSSKASVATQPLMHALPSWTIVSLQERLARHSRSHCLLALLAVYTNVLSRPCVCT